MGQGTRKTSEITHNALFHWHLWIMLLMGTPELNNNEQIGQKNAYFATLLGAQLRYNKGAVVTISSTNAHTPI